jgi:hypothetical protein
MASTIIERFEEKFIPVPEIGCWLWEAATFKDGYGAFRANGKQNRAHRFSYQLYRGEIPDGALVRHKCHVPSCVNPDHLLLGTVADNVGDKVRAERQPRGETHKSSKLTAEQVLAIRADHRSSSEIAKDYPVSGSQVLRIKSHEVWSHV